MKKAVWICLLAVCCNKLPLGQDELSDRGDFTSKSSNLAVFNSFTESKKIPLGASSNLALGKNVDYESRVLLNFTFSDTDYQGLDEIKLVLRRNTYFEKDTIRFSIHLLTSSFTETEATWAKKSNTVTWDTMGGDFETDSLRYVQIAGDSVLVLFNYVELKRIEASSGLILVPEDSGFVYFQSREGGNAAVFQLVKNGAVTNLPLNADCHILNGPEPFYVENWIGSGIASRNFVMFIYDSILAGKKAIYGELTFKPEKFFTMRDSVEIGIKELAEPVSGFDSKLGSLIALERFSVDDTVFKIDIVHYIQRMIDNPDSNYGFFVYLTPENYDISTVKIKNKSYSLEVGYVDPPGER